jgi:hypothetical protein
LEGRDLFNASANLFENHHNKYNKMIRIKRELVILAIVALTTVIVWIIIAPQLDQANIYTQIFIFAVVLSGIMGASVSGILTVARGGAEARIPEQLIGFWILLVKLVVGAVSALALYAFLLSEYLNFATTPAQIIAVCFAAGFSERLVTSAVESVSKVSSK